MKTILLIAIITLTGCATLPDAQCDNLCIGQKFEDVQAYMGQMWIEYSNCNSFGCREIYTKNGQRFNFVNGYLESISMQY